MAWIIALFAFSIGYRLAPHIPFLSLSSTTDARAAVTALCLHADTVVPESAIPEILARGFEAGPELLPLTPNRYTAVEARLFNNVWL